MRIKGGVYTRQRKKKYFRLAKGFYSDKKNHWRHVVQQVEKALVCSYRDRKNRKRYFKRLWITRINALSREFGLPYSRFMAGLRKAGVNIDRKILAEMATQDADSFRQLTDLSKSALTK
jgi:large subunit ribosomal protein L20